MKKNIFADDKEEQLVETLEEFEESTGEIPTTPKKMLSEANRKIVLINVCFSVFKAMNIVSLDGYSSMVYVRLEKYIDPLKYLIFPDLRNDALLTGNDEIVDNKSKVFTNRRLIEPIGLETEVVNFIN